MASLPAQPASYAEGGAELARSLAEGELPESGAPLDELLDLVFERSLSKTYNTAGPGYLAYIPGGGVVHSAVLGHMRETRERAEIEVLLGEFLIQYPRNK